MSCLTPTPGRWGVAAKIARPSPGVADIARANRLRASVFAQADRGLAAKIANAGTVGGFRPGLAKAMGLSGTMGAFRPNGLAKAIGAGPALPATRAALFGRQPRLADLMVRAAGTDSAAGILSRNRSTRGAFNATNILPRPSLAPPRPSVRLPERLAP